MVINPKFIIIGVIVIILIGVGLFTTINNHQSDKIGVLVTIVPQAEMVEAIGGKYIDVTIMVPAGKSPHSFEPTPEQMIKVAQATAYFKVGSGVEFEISYMDTILEQNSDLEVFDCSKNINVISFNEHYGMKFYNMTDKNQNKELGNNGTDPHVWTSPINFIKMTEIVYEGLVQIDPEHQTEYYSNYQTYISKLETLNTNISTLLQPYAGKSFMVYHPAWGYFGDTYHLKMIAIEDEGKQPGPAGINAIISQAREQNITVIFVAPQYDTSSAVTIASEIDGKVIFANPLMTNYEETITRLAEDMVSGFKTT
jgi:zinc transport system substrate-binding protein